MIDESTLVTQEQKLSSIKQDKTAEKRRRKLGRDDKTIEILARHRRGERIADIATITSTPSSTIADLIQRFKPVFTELENVNDFKQLKADILSAAQLTVLKSAFSGNKLEKASFVSTLTGFEILNKAERLERNLSTENTAHNVSGFIQLSGPKKQ